MKVSAEIQVMRSTNWNLAAPSEGSKERNTATESARSANPTSNAKPRTTRSPRTASRMARAPSAGRNTVNVSSPGKVSTRLLPGPGAEGKVAHQDEHRPQDNYCAVELDLARLRLSDQASELPSQPP